MKTDSLLRIFKQTCINRFFELEVARAYDDKLIKSPIYLSVGTEHIPATIAEVKKDWAIFAQHRAHSYALSFGMPPELLAKELLGMKDGSNGGRGGSASFSYSPIGLFGHSGLLGDQVPIGVGYAHASQKPTLVVLGDAAAEEDYVLAALGYASTKKAPVLFIVEDNNLSILTEKKVRRSWNIASAARGLGVSALDIDDNVDDILYCLTYGTDFPYLLNINCRRHLWHSGTGKDNEPEYDIIEDMREALSYTVKEESQYIESKAKLDMELLWERLRKQLEA
jgi:TPP-dependent pyruvate/acetoin dehydrogenase alpha subunit